MLFAPLVLGAWAVLQGSLSVPVSYTGLTSSLLLLSLFFSFNLYFIVWKPA